MAQNCVNNKIDSNFTGLSFAEEVCPGQLPNVTDDGFDPKWYEREPNDYDDFGSEVTTLARAPINASRQRKKGVAVDFDAAGGYNEDLTQNNMDRLFQGFFFADMRQKATTAPLTFGTEPILITGAVAASDTFTAAAGLGVFSVGMLVLVTGAAVEANNGLTKVVSVTGTALGVNKALTDEGSNAGLVIQAVGWELAAAGAAITVVGEIATLGLSANPVAATGTYTIAASQVPDEADTVTIGGLVYTWTATPSDPYEVLIGIDRATSGANLASAINGATTVTPINPYVSAVNAAGVLTLTARIKGTLGNAITLTEAGTDTSVSGATLTGGTGFSLLSMGLLVGEWMFLGDDPTVNHFVNNSGYARIKTVTDTAMVFDKTTWVPEAEAATGLTIRVFTGDVLRNEKDPELIVTKAVQWQRTLGKDTGGTQAQYLPGSVPSELSINLALADKINVDLSYIANNSQTRTGAEGLKNGLRYVAMSEDAINTSSHVFRNKVALLDPATSAPTALVGYAEELAITINNNVTPVKAIGKKGSIGVSVGNFDVDGDATFYFTSVLGLRAIEQTLDATLDLILARENAAQVYDIPLVTLGGGGLEISAGDPVKLTLTQAGAECPAGYTLHWNKFSYVPDLAMPVDD